MARLSGVTILRPLIQFSMRTPKLAIAAALLMLVALSSTMTYAGYLVVSVVSQYLDIGRVAAGFLLGILFARVPYIRQGKWSTAGLLPKNARLPVMLTLLAGSMLHYVLSQAQLVPALFLCLAAGLLLSFRWLRQKVVQRLFAPLFNAARGPARPRYREGNVIDAEFREMKDDRADPEK